MTASRGQYRSVGPALIAVAIVLALYPVRRLYFHSDDFQWLQAASDALRAPGWRLPDDVNGHFRPAAELTWLVGYRCFQMAPFGYFAIALASHFVAALAVARIGERLGGTKSAGLIAGLLFAVNFAHRGALTWLSAAPDRWQAMFLAIAIAAALGGKRGRLVVVMGVAGALLAKESTLVTVAVLPLLAPGWLRAGRRERTLLLLALAALAVPHVAAFAVSSYAQDRFALGIHAARGGWEGLSELLLPAVRGDGSVWFAWVSPDSIAREALGLALLAVVALLASRKISAVVVARWLAAIVVTLLLPALSRDGVESRWLYLPWVLVAPLVACAVVASVAKLREERWRTALVVFLLAGHVLAHGFLLHLKVGRDAARDRWVRGVVEGAATHPPPLAGLGRVEVQVPFGSELRSWPVGVALALGSPDIVLEIIDDRTRPTPGAPWLDATVIPSRWNPPAP